MSTNGRLPTALLLCARHPKGGSTTRIFGEPVCLGLGIFQRFPFLPPGRHRTTRPQVRPGGSEGLKVMKVDNIKPQVGSFIFLVGLSFSRKSSMRKWRNFNVELTVLARNEHHLQGSRFKTFSSVRHSQEKEGQVLAVGRVPLFGYRRGSQMHSFSAPVILVISFQSLPSLTVIFSIRH